MKNFEPIVFNRETETRVLIGSGRISFDAKTGRTRFDQAAVGMMKAKKGMFCHFLCFDNKFYVAVNVNQDGYLLTGITERDGLAVCNTKFIRHFYSKNKITKEKVTYSLIAAEGIAWKDKPVFEIFRQIGE